MNIIIDEEFKDLIPPLSEDEYSALEASILTDGCRDSVVLWNNIIVDGHNRHAICTAHKLPYGRIHRDFEDRNAVIVWMVKNQFARRNISDFLRGELVDKLKVIYKAKAKQRQAEYHGNQHDGGLLATLPKVQSDNEDRVDTREELAKSSGLSARNQGKVSHVLESAPQLIIEAARAGDMSINRADKLTRALKKTPPEYIDRHLELCGDNDEKVSILNRLYKSMGSPETNGTFEEIMRTGGFAYGDEMGKWCDFENDSVQAINKALQSIADYHKRLAIQAKKQDEEEERAAKAEILPSLPFYVNGNCLELLGELEDKTVRLLLTDPPYGTNFQSNRRTETAKSAKIKGDTTPESAAKLLAGMLRVIDRKLDDNARLLIFTSQNNYILFRSVIESMGFSVGRVLTWVKENHTSGNLDDFAPQSEWIINAWQGKTPSLSHRISEVLQYSRSNKTSHPTEKPTALLSELIRVTTIEGELIVDPFAGTGATIESALSMNRKAHGIELSTEWHSEGVIRLSEQL